MRDNHSQAASTILMIDDDRSFLDTIAELLGRAGYTIIRAQNAEDGLALLARTTPPPDLVLLDIRMPGMSGQEALEHIVRHYPALPVIMLTGENAVELIVRAMKSGATNYIYKGAGGYELLTAVSTALEQSRKSRPSTANADSFRHLGIVGSSPALSRLLHEAEMCANSMISVLITGETGVGKDLLARAIHALSPRKSKPFVVVDVPNIQATMFESELFGHMRGAFTGATDNKPGLVQTADEGTLFLDEIGEFPIELQAKFLRVLDSGTVRKLGSVSTENINVRVVSATNRNLLDAVHARTFREDLLYRLRGIEIHVPPLRERREDIGPLASFFLEDFCRKNGMEMKHFSQSALDLLERQRWQGNIRELRRTVEATSVMTPGELIEHTDVARVLERNDPLRPADLTVVHDYNDVQMLARQTKKEELIKILDRNDWNITRAAAELDIDRSTLSKQMKMLGIAKPKLRL